MAYVSVPKDLTKVKNKLVFNLTRRQLICFVLAASIGLPFYFLTREALGTTTSATCMVLLMLPAFLFAILDLYTTLLRKELERPPQERAAEKPIAREESKPRQEAKQEPSKPAKRRSEPSL